MKTFKLKKKHSGLSKLVEIGDIAKPAGSTFPNNQYAVFASYPDCVENPYCKQVLLKETVENNPESWEEVKQ